MRASMAVPGSGQAERSWKKNLVSTRNNTSKRVRRQGLTRRKRR